MASIEELLSRTEPLNREAALLLASYGEENNWLDYKQSFDNNLEKNWLEITKDISAFANTYGGYLVFGISDSKKNVIGLTRSTANLLKDVNNIAQKINRYLEPHIISLRSKEFRIKGKSIVVLHVPRSVDETHLISKDGSFTYPTGKKKVVLQKGTFYIRRSASNHLGDSRDLKDLIERRINQFRDSLMDKVARVVESPATSDLLILSKDPNDTTSKQFIIEDSPASIPIKGMSFTIPPKGNEEKIAAWSVLSEGTSLCRPPPEVVWQWYSDRSSIKINDKHKLDVFQFSLWSNVPYFYWVKGQKAQVIKAAVLTALRERPSNDCVRSILIVASFLGENFYNEMLSKTGNYKNRLSPAMRKFPHAGPKKTFGKVICRANIEQKQLIKEQLSLLNDIAKEGELYTVVPDRLFLGLFLRLYRLRLLRFSSCENSFGDVLRRVVEFQGTSLGTSSLFWCFFFTHNSLYNTFVKKNTFFKCRSKTI